MPRAARLVLPGVPHHVTQRGNRRQQTFFCDDDYALYLNLLRYWCGRAQTAVWAWCLMPNHVHLQACFRYVELNPVRAGLIARPED